MVSYNDKRSSIVSVVSGIAQGTVLGPVIFIFYINDIVRSLNRCHISMITCLLSFDLKGYLKNLEFMNNLTKHHAKYWTCIDGTNLSSIVNLWVYFYIIESTDLSIQ